MPVSLRRHWRIVIDVALYVTLVTLYVLSGTVLSVPLAVAQLVPLVWRRRAPGTVLAVISVATAAHSLLGMGRAVGYLPVSLAMYTAATHRSPAVRWGVCAAATVLVTVTGAIRRGPVEGGLLAAVALTVTWLAGVERGEHLRERATIAGLRLERRLAEQAAAAARSRERLARRLHDSLAHTMTVMLVQGEALRTTARLAPADEHRLDTVLRAGRDALAEVRLALAEEAERDTAATLTERLDAVREAGLTVPATLVDELAVLPAGVREVTFRLVGEVATNALRHDGPGTGLRAELDRDGDRWTLRLTSQRPSAGQRPPAGHRPPAAGATTGSAGGGGYGLRSLDADVRAAGGTLRYGPRDAGWQVTAEFPDGAVGVHAGG
ncbi:histidine kinase [Dactylosporangium sp. NPDC049525]|uniref:histidine kinase n=1 Tax=Dactylosporangium sp. NPDC049525 TaxID=3154730 RepID=UPI00343A57CB